MSRWAERARARTAQNEALTKPTEGAKEGVLALLAVTTPSAFPPEMRKRLRTLAAAANCPEVLVDNLHPLEIEAYGSYPDGEVVASLRHLVLCRECRERQCRPVSCGTCARFLADPLNPEVGMGQCAGAHGVDGPLTFPGAQRHCVHWLRRN